MNSETDGGSPDPSAEDVSTSTAEDGETGGDTSGGRADGSGSEGPNNPAGTPGLGRRILLAVGAIVVVLSGGIGWLVGSNGALDTAAVLGTGFTIPVTPGTVALYGLVVSTTILGGVFRLVELASRLEGGRGEPE